uniref:SCP domain-containing protein n=1 Tax=Lygus hesperus TaxID=30085 RepID=A0A0K8T6U2_LYGHE
MRGGVLLVFVLATVCTMAFGGHIKKTAVENRCLSGRKHTMCRYKAQTAIRTCKDIVDVQSPSSRKVMLHLHNEYRDKIASGKIKGWPQAANMRQMSWDYFSEAVALRWVQQCKPGHDDCRPTQTFHNVGQNWGSEAFDTEFPTSNGTFAGWIEEINSVKRPTSLLKKFRDGNWRHFTQVIWANSDSLGCGEIHALDGGLKATIVTCNYGPTGNFMDKKMYLMGEPCSQCPEGTACKPNSAYPHLCAKPTDDIEPVDIPADPGFLENHLGIIKDCEEGRNGECKITYYNVDLPTWCNTTQ